VVFSFLSPANLSSYLQVCGTFAVLTSTMAMRVLPKLPTSCSPGFYWNMQCQTHLHF
jgi:hypothetical protein